MDCKFRAGMLAGSIAVCASLVTSTASAFTVDVSGAFDPNSLTHTNAFIFKRFYNQDDVSPAPVSLPGNLQSSTDSVAYFGWGIDVTESIVTQQVIQSHFWFNGVGSAGGAAPADVALGDTFSLGTFTYTNEQTLFSGGVVGIDFALNLDIDGLALSNILYRIEIDNTTNGGSNPTDTASLISMPAPALFTLGGIDYQLTLNGFSRNAGASFETQATLAEGAQTSAEIFATISQVAVPVPAAFWLFASGLAVMTGAMRRRRTRL